MKSIPRSSKVDTSALDVSGEGGIGAPKGMTSEILVASLTPRSRRYSSNNSTASLGAGGHLNEGPHTPTMAAPSVNPAIASPAAIAPVTE